MIHYIIVSHLFSSSDSPCFKIVKIIYVVYAQDGWTQSMLSTVTKFIPRENVCVNMFNIICIKLFYILLFATLCALSLSLTMPSIYIVKSSKIWKMWEHASRYLNLQFSSVICQDASSTDCLWIISDIVFLFDIIQYM